MGGYCRYLFRRTQFGWWPFLPVSDDGDRSGTRLRFFVGRNSRSERACNPLSIKHFPSSSESYWATEMRECQLTGFTQVGTRGRAKDFRYDIQENASRG